MAKSSPYIAPKVFTSSALINLNPKASFDEFAYRLTPNPLERPNYRLL
jgi:hypothetical protein